MPEYLYKVTPARAGMVADPTPEEEEIVGQHFLRLKELTEKGMVLLVGRTQTTGPETFGIVIFRADSDEAARDFMNQDPAVKAGVMLGEVFSYKVALLAGGTLDGWREESSGPPDDHP